MVAVKVIKNVPKYRDAARIELEVLRVLNAADPRGLKHCVHLRDDFDFRGHICMVFDLLGVSLFDFMKENSFRPFELQEVQHFAVQLMAALDHMHSHKLTHTDLKPENIMVDHPEKFKNRQPGGKLKYVLKRTNITVIDFGSATFEDEHHTSIVSTRHYRAPEVILALTWTHPCDLWSIGCILMELFTGSALFQTHDDIEHLAMMEQILGPISKEMVKEATRALKRKGKVYFDSSHQLLWPAKAKERDSKKFVMQHCKPLKELIAGTDPLSVAFLELMESLLRFKAHKRVSSRDALALPFIASFAKAEYAQFQETRNNSGNNSLELVNHAPTAAAAPQAAPNQVSLPHDSLPALPLPEGGAENSSTTHPELQTTDATQQPCVGAESILADPAAVVADGGGGGGGAPT
jgi:serine/threonine protein kinase